MLERLELAYLQATRFSADASHELRTPLTIMRSELERLLASLRESSADGALADRVGSILEEAERLSGIVESLFALARLDAGEAIVENRPFDLAKTARNTIDQMQLLADEKRLSTTVEAEQPIIVAGDESRIKQVIVNLFDNAIKHTHDGGAIRVSVKAEKPKAVLSVIDNGVGISAEALPHVFERFYQGNKNRRSVGAGLGLSIVRTICHAHGGTVRIHSVVDTGTTVTVELPLAENS
jgi:signal transduction histidine kinase